MAYKSNRILVSHIWFIFSNWDPMVSIMENQVK